MTLWANSLLPKKPDKLVRKIAKMKVEVNDLRADYTTLKAELMFKSKQSEVAKEVQSIGLEESMVPPQKIDLEEIEYYECHTT